MGKITKTPTDKFLPIWIFIKTNKIITSFIIIFLIIFLFVVLYFQCKANTGRTAQSTLWHDFKMVGLYFFGLFSSTISTLVNKFNNWINE
jgi:hypothetical protein